MLKHLQDQTELNKQTLEKNISGKQSGTESESSAKEKLGEFDAQQEQDHRLVDEDEI